MGLNRGGGSDGPAGVARGGGVTAFPTPLSVAATFDPDMAARYGDLMGQDFFEAGLNGMTGPAIDLTRTWHFGRATESFGEDPFLIAGTVGPEIAAIQRHHVMTTMKHYAAYTQEQGRCGDQPTGDRPAVNQEISVRALREIYLPGFKAAVIRGGAGSVMCSFPRINGVYACENPYLMDILKKEWGFDGSVGPDFPDAQRSIIPAFLAGLDSGVLAPAGPGGMMGAFTGQKSLRQGVEDGEVPVSRIDDIILRRLDPGFRIGVFDNPAKRKGEDISTPERRAAAADVLAAGSVLLKNDKGVLPFGPNIRSLAIVGTQAAEKAIVVEQGSPYVAPTHLEPVLPAVRARAGPAVRVTFAPGTLGLAALPDLPKAMLKTASGQPGVAVEYFANPRRDFSGKPLEVRTEDAFRIEKTPDIPGLPANLQWSARYTALFTPAQTGIQHFTLSGSGSAKLFIGGAQAGEYSRADFADVVYANVMMTAGREVEIRIEFTPRASFGSQVMVQFGTKIGVYAALGWSGPHDLLARAAEAARMADAAVVFVGHQIGEGMDRLNLGLPNDQDALIEAVAEANPKTVVVLNTGGAVTMPWLDKVAAVLEMWLPGDAYGPAAAKLLFGDAEPGGRLPITFPEDETQGPATQPSQYPGTLDSDGSLATAHFDEGIFIGYRYWDQYGQTPLFPFGYGLSYSTFAMKGVRAEADPDGGATVRVLVKNTGKRIGSEVVQIYLDFPEAAAEPPKQLKGYQKVLLQPGGEKAVRIKLDADAFEYWDEQARAWTRAAGTYRILVGRSSREIVTITSLTPLKR
jgi:beta-glucosidase